MKISHCPATVKILSSIVSVVRMPADITTGNIVLDLRGTDFVDPKLPKEILLTLQNISFIQHLLLTIKQKKLKLTTVNY